MKHDEHKIDQINTAKQERKGQMKKGKEKNQNPTKLTNKWN